MNKNVKNLAVSIKQKLMNYSKLNNLNFNLILIQYFNERLLYRLSVSKYRTNFILKGALLLMAQKVGRIRPTKDIDFLGYNIANNVEEIKEVFINIANIDYEDGVTFDTNSISLEQINEPNEYKGVRLKIAGVLDSIKQQIQVDIGFGDIVYPSPVIIEFPTILDLDAPKLLVYSLESSIAEKFEAIISLGLANSRMKDFYDIYYLSLTKSFNSFDLSTAIKDTFKRRNTSLEVRENIFNELFINDKDKQIMWIAFLSRNHISLDIDFPNVVKKIEEFIEPIINTDKILHWSNNEWIWK